MAVGSLMATITAVWSELQRTVSRYLGYGRAAPTSGSDEETDINDAIRSGLRRFYHAGHPWSFLYPREVLETETPFSDGTITVTADSGGSIVTLAGATWPTAIPTTGTDTGWRIRVDNDGYDIKVRNSTTQVILKDTQVTFAAGTSHTTTKYRYDLPDDFIAFYGKGMFTYQPGTGDLYGPLERVREDSIRNKEQDFDWSHHPTEYALIPKPFDATVGQRWQVQLWPVPDARYRFHYRYEHDPEMLDATNVHHWGGTPHSETIKLACLAGAEEMLNDGSTQMQQRFLAALQVSIKHDRHSNAPERLGQFMDPSESMYAGYPTREELLVDYRQPHPVVEGT